MNRKRLGMGLLLTGCVMLDVGLVLAQRPADAKVRGDAYYFYLGEVYRGHAGDHGFLLNQYSATGKPVPTDVIQEHAAAIRTNIEAAQKSYIKVTAAAKKDPNVVAGLKGIEKNHATALSLCDKLDAECTKREGDSATICATCEGIGNALDAADATHQKLLKQLKIAPLESPGP
jgi:hypothetical protein